MLFKFLVFLSVALVSEAAQDLNTTVQNEINNIPEIVKTSLLNREPSSLAFDINEDRDGAIANFLTHAMENYHTWLAKEDPLTPDPAEVILNSTALGDADLSHLDVLWKISNQYMADYSKHGLENVVFSASSNESRGMLEAGRRVNGGQEFTFGGDYNVAGALKISDALEIPFSGQGRWILKANDLTESITYSRYTVDENGYIDLSTSLTDLYFYFLTWTHIEFEGLQFNYDGDIDAAWMPRLKDGLATLYERFLRKRLAFEQFLEHNLPRKLVNTYLQERLKTTKLEDIVSGWQPTTPQETEPTTPPDTGHGNNIVGSLWTCILVLGIVFNV